METIVDGWPNNSKHVPKAIRSYWSCRDELSVDDGLVIKGDRIIIPEAMREEALQKIHAGHQGIKTCKLRAKTFIFWPGISNDIEPRVSTCSAWWDLW